MKKIKLKMNVTSALITAVVLVCVIFLNAIVSIIGDKISLKADLTRDKVYEFSQQTKDVMKNLDADVNAYALIPDSIQSEYLDYIEDYLSKYAALSKHFKIEYFDPYENPQIMQKYADEENQAGIGSVIIECGEKYKVITLNQMYQQNSYSGVEKIDLERKVTNAIMSVAGMLETAKIYYVSGHGEYYPHYLDAAIENDGFKGEELNISTSGIPEDASIIISVCPTADLTAQERDAIDEFTDKGGKFVFIATAGLEKMERIDAYLEEWGIALNYDFVVEADSSKALASGSTGTVPIPVPTINEHSITSKIMDSESPLPMPYSMSMSDVKSANSAVVTKLLTTSSKSYGKTDVKSQSINRQAGDISGPLTVAAISENQTTGGSVLVIGSLQAIETPGLLDEGAYLNGDFILNAINYLTGGEGDTGIRAKQISAETMTMKDVQVVFLNLILQWVIPFAILLIGLIVWLRRRYK